MLIPSVIYYRSNVVHTQIVPVADSYNVSLQTLRFRFFHAVPCNKESNLCWTFEPLAKFHAFHNYETAFLSWKHTESQLKKSNFSKHLSFDAIRHRVSPWENPSTSALWGLSYLRYFLICLILSHGLVPHVKQKAITPARNSNQTLSGVVCAFPHSRKIP